MTKVIGPSIRETAFACPHCGAYTTQFWFELYAKPKSDDNPTPTIPTEKRKIEVAKNPNIPNEQKEKWIDWIDKMLSGLVFLDRKDNGEYCHNDVHNLYLSKCYNCKKYAVWIHERLVFPPNKVDVTPNSDMPNDIRHDFEEAREIVDSSPRGAAALLRLSIQKLCKYLGEKGNKIDDDIGNLVKKGLNPLVQRSLDIVRVIGNESAHPGLLDLRDDRDTVMQLLGLVNAICEQMISHPKTVQEMYEKLPEEKRKAIEKRNGKT